LCSNLTRGPKERPDVRIGALSLGFRRDSVDEDSAQEASERRDDLASDRLVAVRQIFVAFCLQDPSGSSTG